MTSHAGDINHDHPVSPVSRIALIGDVHSNLLALEAVLDHANGQRAEAIWNTGDFVGYGAFPDEVIQRLREQGDMQVIGNYDKKVLKVKKKQRKWVKTKNPLKLMAFDWTYDHLSRTSLDYLRSLPKEIRGEIGGRRYLLTHGSPASIQEPLSPQTSSERLLELASTAECEVIICGHSHQQLALELAEVWFINPGSVGRPDDGDPRASYAILDLTSHELKIFHHRVEYDVFKAAEEIRAAGLPEQFAQMVLQGRSLDEIELVD